MLILGWSHIRNWHDLVLWCYGRKGNRLLLPIIQLLRAIGRRLPIAATHSLAKVVTFVAWPAIQMWPSRTVYYKNLKRLSYRNVESIIFDQMLPEIAHYWTREEVEALTDTLDGATTALELVQGNSWNIRIRKRPISLSTANR